MTQYYVYILANNAGTVLYPGVTNDLKRRVFEHKNRLVEGFTKRYNIDRLVYYAVGGNIEGVIAEEKRIKGGSRNAKIALINSMNKEWRDLMKSCNYIVRICHYDVREPRLLRYARNDKLDVS
ncbi:MAG: GIY-YIG nuclease family protein [Dehalococcoidales bacterium]|nr:GIY-YIG nuclease family protein [Dehalococcoidales bacterium]